LNFKAKIFELYSFQKPLDSQLEARIDCFQEKSCLIFRNIHAYIVYMQLYFLTQTR